MGVTLGKRGSSEVDFDDALEAFGAAVVDTFLITTLEVTLGSRACPQS